MKDIYFEKDYGKLYENMEDGTCEVFEYKNSFGKIQHMFIKREIPLRLNNTIYFDLITPYGYGGPLITECKKGYEQELTEGFNTAFKKYCKENKIVAEFVRFHPIVRNALDFETIYEVDKVRKTVGTNIEEYEDPFMEEFSKSARKTIRRALRSGVNYKITKSPGDISAFKEIYYSTMDRNEASDYYYFDDQYFQECLKNFKDNIILVEVLLDEKIIAAGFYFVYNNIIHAHLSGTLKEYLKFSPAYIIKYATVEWAKEHGVKLIHYGGGTSNDESDPLYKFKKRFGKNTEFDFHIGKKVWNKEVYEELCEITNSDDTNFFPKYRGNL